MSTKVPKHLSDNMSYHSAKPCNCGSDEDTLELHDARGIFIAYCCDACVVDRAKGYRREIFENRRYEADDLGDDE